jgi:hypothetical protein
MVPVESEIIHLTGTVSSCHIGEAIQYGLITGPIPEKNWWQKTQEKRETDVLKSSLGLKMPYRGVFSLSYSG